MDKYIVDERTGWKYELIGDYYFPVGTRFDNADEKPENELPDRPAIGRFGREHCEFLRNNLLHVYLEMAFKGTLDTYLAQIDKQANDMLSLLTRQMAELEDVTEDLKAANPMAWVRAMNSIRSRAIEIVHAELIYA